MGRVIALIPAAGRGLRMGLEIDKPYLRIGARPVLAHTLDAFESCPLIDGVLVVAQAERTTYCREQVVEAFGYRRVCGVVSGGATRQESVYKGLQALDADTDIVVVHDGARPCLDPALIIASVRVCRSHGAALVAVPVKDTVKAVREGVVTGTPDRSALWLAQTPQAFSYRILCEAHERARAERFEGSDDAVLVERLGHPVPVVRGDYENIKLTTPDDLAIAAHVLRRKGRMQETPYP